MKKKLFIIGAGFPDAIRTFRNSTINQFYDLVGILDDNPLLLGKNILGVKIVGSLDLLNNHRGVNIFNSVGLSKASRNRVNKKLENYEVIFQSIIHQNVNTENVIIEPGCFIAQTAYLEPNSSIGEGTMLLPGVTVGHDTKIGQNCFISSGVHIGGNVRVGDYCWIGAGSCIHPNSAIGNGSVIDMNSRVIIRTSEEIKIGDRRSNVTLKGNY